MLRHCLIFITKYICTSFIYMKKNNLNNNKNNTGNKSRLITYKIDTNIKFQTTLVCCINKDNTFMSGDSVFK